MKLTRSVVLGLAIVALATPLRAQTTLGFEGLTGGLVPQGYGGFSWLGGIGASSWQLAYPTSGLVYRPSSGVVNVWSGGGTTLDMLSAPTTLFDFNSVFLSGVFGGCYNVSNMNQTVRGFLAGVQQYSSTVSISCSVMQQFTFNFLGIDQVQFDQAINPVNLLVDDITINSPTNSVPEPASLALLATGLVGLIPAARRKFNI
jgi:hypothetical protein